jgi:hypothetical protein
MNPTGIAVSYGLEAVIRFPERGRYFSLHRVHPAFCPMGVKRLIFLIKVYGNG